MRIENISADSFGNHPILKVREMEIIVMRLNKWIPQLATLVVFLLACSPTMADTFLGNVSVGNSASMFQIGQGTSLVTIDISAIGARDPTLCPSCMSSYSDNYTVEFFGANGTMLSSQNETNYLYYNMFTSSNGIGAGPVFLTAPGGATEMEIVSNLSISGLLLGGSPLSFGNLIIASNGSITAATPLPPSLMLLASVVAVVGLFGWYRGRKTTSLSFGTP
jgi:hypothetical protein